MKDKKKSMARVAARRLSVDPAVQRDVEETHVQKLVSNWDDTLVGVLIASKRPGGVLVLLDGFQRHTAVMRQGNPGYIFDVQVHEGLTLQEEAYIFLGHNRGRKNVSAYHVHRVAVTQGDPVALAIEGAVAAAGFSVGAVSSDKVVGCVATMNRVVGRQGCDIDQQAEYLRKALTTFHATWGGFATKDSWRSEVVEALCLLYMKHDGALNESSLVRKLSRISIPQLIAAARGRAVGSNRVPGHVYNVIVEVYDKGKSVGRLRPSPLVEGAA